jgi:O-antigen/teichoic acid export membrane protein
MAEAFPTDGGRSGLGRLKRKGMEPLWIKYLPLFLRQRFEGRLYLQNVVSNTGWLLADKIIRMGVGFFVGIWVARYLGPEQFGLLSFAFAFVALFSAISSLGLEGIVIRNIVRDPPFKDKILGTAFILKCIGGIVAFLIVLGGIALIRPGDSLAHWLVGITAAGMIFQAFDTIDFWFQSQVQSKYSIYAKNSAFLVVSAAKVYLILTGASLVAFAWAGFAEIVLGSVWIVIAYQATGHQVKEWQLSYLQAKNIFKDSWPLLMSGIAIMIYMRIDQVMLDIIAGDQEVGIYSAAVRLVEAWYFIPMVAVSSVFPSIVEAKTISDDLFYERLQKLYNFLALMAYIIAVPMTFLSGWIVETLFGAAYSKAGPMLAVLIWSILFTNLGIARSTFLTTMNWTRTHLMTVSLGCIINVILNYLLIPQYGGMGAVIASCVAYWFATHGTCFIYHPLVKTGHMLSKAIIYPKVW